MKESPWNNKGRRGGLRNLLRSGWRETPHPDRKQIQTRRRIAGGTTACIYNINGVMQNAWRMTVFQESSQISTRKGQTWSTQTSTPHHLNTTLELIAPNPQSPSTLKAILKARLSLKRKLIHKAICVQHPPLYDWSSDHLPSTTTKLIKRDRHGT